MNFVIVGATRTGSSHLASYLNRHPEICCHGEAFNPRRVHVRYGKAKVDAAGKQRLESELKELRTKDPPAFLERLFRFAPRCRHAGFKIFEGHHRDVLEAMLENDSIRKVVLFRANALARFASNLAAKETQTWGSNPERPPVEFDAKLFEQQTARYFRFFARTLRTLNQNGQSYFFLRSDELNNELRLIDLLRFIGAEPILPKQETVFERVRGSADIASRFSNANDVLTYLRAKDLMHWAYEGDLYFQHPSIELH